MNIREQLRLIREGTLILEAPSENRYDLPSNLDNEGGDVKKATNKNTEEQQASTDNKPDTESKDDDTDGPVTPDDLSDDETDESDNEDDEGSNDNTDVNNNIIEDKASKPGEVINIDDNTRAILAYKNFSKFRELRDSVSRMLNDISSQNTTSDEIRAVMSKVIDSLVELLEKLNDYILYRYTENSYEINYKNYMLFLSEKKIIDELVGTIKDKLKNLNKTEM